MKWGWGRAHRFWKTELSALGTLTVMPDVGLWNICPAAEGLWEGTGCFWVTCPVGIFLLGTGYQGLNLLDTALTCLLDIGWFGEGVSTCQRGVPILVEKPREF